MLLQLSLEFEALGKYGYVKREWYYVKSTRIIGREIPVIDSILSAIGFT